MTIDGDLQITEMDECHYHEMMVHVPLASRKPGAGAPRVLIIGGGDGGCAREALRWPGATVTLVDIDAAVLDAARRFFPACAAGLDDPRTEVHVPTAPRSRRRPPRAEKHTTLSFATRRIVAQQNERPGRSTLTPSSSPSRRS